MSNISIQRELNIAARFEKLSQAEKTAGAAQAQGTASTEKTQSSIPSASSTISTGLQQMLDKLGQTDQTAQTEILQTGEGALAEAKDILNRMSRLAQEAQSEGADRPKLQAELKELLSELDRVLQSADYEGASLFQGEDAQMYESLLEDLETLLSGTTQTPSDGQGQVSTPTDIMQQLLDELAQGVPIDQALQSLTGAEGASLLSLMDLFGGEDAQQLMTLLNILMTSGGQGTLSLGDAATLSLLEGLNNSQLNLLVSMLATRTPAGTETAPQSAPEPAAQQFGQFLVTGQDLSGVTFSPDTNTITLTGEENVTIQGGQEAPQAEGASQPTIVLSGTGQVKLQNVEGTRLVVTGQEARVLTAGGNTLGEVRMEQGASVEFGGEGLLETGRFTADGTNRITVTGGALSVEGGQGSLNGAQVYMAGCASLAAQVRTVQTPGGQAEPFDVLWKALLPGWKQIDGMIVDGQRTQMSLFQSGEQMSAARLWLNRETDPSHGHPIHSVTIMGRDEADEQQVHSVWVRWDEAYNSFRQITMYPNPFAVNGGEQGVDWIYEEDTQTLRVLTDRVVGISGGTGLDAQQEEFSGRLAIESNLGDLELTLGGITCHALAGRAFELGRENHVTLYLRDGSANTFESAEGYAGISLGDGTTLMIDAAPAEEPEDGGEETETASASQSEGADSEVPVGILIARGGDGGAGIGRDSGGSWDRISRITIAGGTVEASGTGGGAGIGAGRHGFMGDVVITGGTVTAEGGPGGGAGIGGALGAPVGDIRIQGGTITAVAVYHAAAIGAGVEGECGDVYIGPAAHILKAQGGDPETTIGACRFGKCGKVQVEACGAKDTVAVGLPFDDTPLPQWSDAAELPRFVITPRMLRLRNLDLSTFESAWAAEGTINAASRHIELVEGIYYALSGQLKQGDGSSPLRSAADADALLNRAQSSIRQTSPNRVLKRPGRKGREAVLKLLAQKN